MFSALALLTALAPGQPLRAQEAARPTAPPQSGESALSPAPSPALPVEAYIHDAWHTLERSMNQCTSLVDPKINSQPVLYLPVDFTEPPQVAGLESKCGVKVERLPVRIGKIGQKVPITVSGLLYLPNTYVVPGGRFNEMYGWDSYFIILGLLHDHMVDVAHGMVENFFFEIDHYGGLLNANRTYYLTRSQPPFLSSEIRDIWKAYTSAGHQQQARAWLERGYSFAQKDHALWMTDEHRAGNTGLARYFDFGEGPVPEMADDDTYYQNVISWLLAHPNIHTGYLVDGPAHPTRADRGQITSISCDPAVSGVCERAHIGNHWLTRDFYKGDRAMRESGFDPSFRFGPFDGSTHHFAPVCLNSLLYKYENDLAWMADQLGKPDEAKRWRAIAEARRTAIDRYLWNAKIGMYFDYDYVAGKQSTYRYVTTFYPLWAGVTSADQAHKVEANLGVFNRRGGLAMSTYNSGVQWDLPYGWAPTTWIAVDGLAKAGDTKDAALVSQEFMKTIQNSYACDHTIREKFNVVSGSSEFQVTAGYRQNVVGFGWTNAAYLKMQSLLQKAGIPAPQPPKACVTRSAP